MTEGMQIAEILEELRTWTSKTLKELQLYLVELNQTLKILNSLLREEKRTLAHACSKGKTNICCFKYLQNLVLWETFAFPDQYDPKQKLKPCRTSTPSCFTPAKRLKIFQQVIQLTFFILWWLLKPIICRQLFLLLLKSKKFLPSPTIWFHSVHQATKDKVAAELSNNECNPYQEGFAKMQDGQQSCTIQPLSLGIPSIEDSCVFLCFHLCFTKVNSIKKKYEVSLQIPYKALPGCCKSLSHVENPIQLHTSKHSVLFCPSLGARVHIEVIIYGIVTPRKTFLN